MKRSLANSAIRYAEELLNQYNFQNLVIGI